MLFQGYQALNLKDKPAVHDAALEACFRRESGSATWYAAPAHPCSIPATVNKGTPNAAICSPPWDDLPMPEANAQTSAARGGQ